MTSWQQDTDKQAQDSKIRDAESQGAPAPNTSAWTPLREPLFRAFWVEYPRQHERVTLSDRDVEARSKVFHTGPEPPLVSHFVAQPIAIPQLGRNGWEMTQEERSAR